MTSETLRQRVAERIERRFDVYRRQRYHDFYRHVRAFLTTILPLWGICLIAAIFMPSLMASAMPWPLYITLGWGIILISDGLRAFSETHFLGGIREREFQRELALEWEREGVYDAAYEKPKRGVVTLGDDGELVYEDDFTEKPKKRMTEQ